MIDDHDIARLDEIYVRKDDWEKAKSDKITDGTAPQGLITRQEVVTMINRANTAKG